VRSLLAAAALAAVLAACGGSSSSSSSAPTASETTVAAAAPATSAPATSDTTPVVLDPVGPNAPGGKPYNGILCETQERVALHIHAGLVIFLHGQQVTVPAYIGFNDDTCLYWLHTHADAGVIHIESPSTKRVFTLGEFFGIWGYPLSSTEIAGVPVTVHAWVNGKVFMGDPSTIPLADAQTIVLSDTDIPADQLPSVDTTQP
jgi:hypothetical protein